jgi:hypothetical protein
MTLLRSKVIVMMADVMYLSRILLNYMPLLSTSLYSNLSLCEHLVCQV